MIWFTSDTHYDHKNICRGVSQWPDKARDTRDYDTLDQMNDVIVNNINSCVMQDDILYHLGDWSFGGIQNIPVFRRRLLCQNIHLVYGNHDENILKNKEIRNQSILINTAEFNYSSLAQEYFSSTQGLLQFRDEHGQEFTLCHYALQIWEHSHKGSINLYGHSHGRLPDSGLRQMDVGMDANNMMPISIDQVKKILNKRQINNRDFHN